MKTHLTIFLYLFFQFSTISANNSPFISTPERAPETPNRDVLVESMLYNFYSKKLKQFNFSDKIIYPKTTKQATQLVLNTTSLIFSLGADIAVTFQTLCSLSIQNILRTSMDLYTNIQIKT